MHSLASLAAGCLLLLLLLLPLGLCVPEPVSPLSAARARLLSPARGLLGVSGVLGAAALRRYLDGPAFLERPDLRGRTVLITGASSGLGRETALGLASLGASLVLLCRTKDKAEEAARAVRAATGSSEVLGVGLDLGSLASVKEGALAVRRALDGRRIDVMVNNAGIMALPQRTLTQDGFEAHLGVNHLGHFALTARLFDLLAPTARVVTVASAAHQLGHLDFADMGLEKTYEPWPAYGRSKLANVLFSSELAR